MQNNLQHQSEYSTIFAVAQCALHFTWLNRDNVILTKNSNHTALEIDLYILYTQ